MERQPSPLAALQSAWTVPEGPLDPTRIFARRLKHPRLARALLPLSPLQGIQASAALAAALAEGPQSAATARAGRVVYLHIPFCARQRCTFCGFSRETLDQTDGVGEGRARAYVDALCAQLRRWGATTWARSAPFSALHIGGGTPTVLPVEDLERLLVTARASLPLAEGAELSLESCPSTIPTVDELQRLRAAGLGRLVLGVQTFDAQSRKALGRHSSHDQLLAAIERATSIIPAVAVDLLYGLADQSEAIWQADLETLTRTRVVECSLNTLRLFHESELTQQATAGQLDLPLSPQREYGLFVQGDHTLRSWGWRPLTPTHYVAPGGARARYLRARSRGAEVLALGAAAAGQLGNLSYVQTSEIDVYLRAQQTGDDHDLHVAQWPSSEPPAALAWLALSEGDGVSQQAIVGLLPTFDALLPRLREVGLVEAESGRWTLTTAGRYWAINLSALICQLTAEHTAMSTAEVNA